MANPGGPNRPVILTILLAACCMRPAATGEPSRNTETFRLEPLPAALAAKRGVHPRLYLDAQRIANLREAIKTTHAPLWNEVREQADAFAKRGAPKYILRDRSSGDEQLWQRGVGNAMPCLAMAWVLSGEKQYLDAAREWALASCSYPTWGLGRIDGMDLAAGHQLFGLGIVYDWCYDGLGEDARRTIRETLVKRASAMFEAARTGKAWWQKSYLQNHLWVDICGMSVAGFALFDEVDAAQQWIALPLDKFQRTMKALGDDGASHEGVGYWSYGVEYMLKFMDLARDLLGVDMYQNDWWRNTAAYRLYLGLPRAAWTRRNSIVDLADCPRSDWYGPDYLLRALARQYRDGHAQWLAREIDATNIDGPEARWLNLVWYDPALEAKPPSDLPTLRHFKDLDIVSARSGWSGDESLVVFKCGPYIGHKGVEEFDYDPGGGHVHPDANHFVLFGGGEWLVRDDGYRAKWTHQHNTLLIDGKGQLGEGAMWFRGTECLKAKARPRILRAASSPALDQITGDATEAYVGQDGNPSRVGQVGNLSPLGLKRYVRHLLFLKPDVLIVADDIEADRDRELELRFHPEQNRLEKDGVAFLARGENARLRIEPLTRDGVNIAAADLPAAGRSESTGLTSSMFTLRLSKKAAQWRNAVALSWAKSGATPAAVTLKQEGDTWRFTAGDRTVTLDWKTGEAK